MTDTEALGSLLDGVGTVGLVLLVGWMLATGRLVTRREHEALLRRCERLEEMVLSSANATREVADSANAVIAHVIPDPGGETS